MLSENRLAPFYGESKSVAKHASDPIEQAADKLTRHTLSCPLTIGSTTIFNMASVEPLQKLMMQRELSEENLAECRKVIYSLLSMENKGEQLPIPILHQKSRTTSKKDEYKIMFGELEQFLTTHCRTENHHKVLDCLLEVRNKAGDYPRPTPRNKDKVGLDEALMELDRSDRDFSLSNDGVLRSTADTPMSPTPSAAKKPKKSLSLLDLWTKRIEKENNHAPYAGQTTFGEVAKLYLSLDRKDDPQQQQQPIE